MWARDMGSRKALEGGVCARLRALKWLGMVDTCDGWLQDITRGTELTFSEQKDSDVASMNGALQASSDVRKLIATTNTHLLVYSANNGGKKVDSGQEIKPKAPKSLASEAISAGYAVVGRAADAVLDALDKSYLLGSRGKGEVQEDECEFCPLSVSMLSCVGVSFKPVTVPCGVCTFYVI